jgi:hypothetical protein
MKPELDSQLRERFCAQYLGQRVFYRPHIAWKDHEIKGEKWVKEIVTLKFIDLIVKHCTPLTLRSLKDITGPEAIEVAKSAGELHFIKGFPDQAQYFSVDRKDNLITISERYHSDTVVIDTEDGQVLVYDALNEVSASINTLWAYQILISKGFALPFMGHTLSELEEAGWIEILYS